MTALSRILIASKPPSNLRILARNLAYVLHTTYALLGSRMDLGLPLLSMHFQDGLLEHYFSGNKDLVKDHLCSFLPLAEYLLACKEQQTSMIWHLDAQVPI